MYLFNYNYCSSESKHGGGGDNKYCIFKLMKKQGFLAHMKQGWGGSFHALVRAACALAFTD